MGRVQGTRSSNFIIKVKIIKTINVFLQICRKNSRSRAIMNVKNRLIFIG